MPLTLGWPWRQRSLERSRGQRKQHLQSHCRPRLESLEDRTLPSVLMVTNINDSGPGSLRAQIAKADDGDTIKFAAGLTGTTITLTSGEIAVDIGLDIQGLGASKLAISGNMASRIFNIGPDASAVTITGLTLKNGLAGQGGAILDDGAPLTLKSEILSNDQASSPLGAKGGALAIAASSTAGMTVSISNCRFANDAVIGGAGGPGQQGGDNLGGAMYVEADFSAGLTLTVTGTSFTSDSATGGSGGDGIAIGPTTAGNGGSGQGGAVFIDATFAAQPSFAFSNDTFSNCSATGGAGGNAVSGSIGATGGPGSGGALAYNADFAASPALSVSTCSFSFNTALGGNGGAGGDAVASADNGGNAGGAGGGAVFADFRDSAAGGDSFTADTLDFNRATGGVGGTGGTGDGGLDGASGGSGGAAFGGGFDLINSDLATGTQVTVAQCSINHNSAQGGNGGVGGAGAFSGGHGGLSGAADGGGLYLLGSSGPFDTWTLTGDAIALNAAITGDGGAGGAAHLIGGNGGNAEGSSGGGVWAAGLKLEIFNSTIIQNSVVDGAGGPGGGGASPGSPGSSGLGEAGGLLFGLGTVCANSTVIANNTADLDTDMNVMPGPC
jgi:hypothetical protein